MEKIALITDSASDINPELVKKYNINIAEIICKTSK